MNACVAQWSEHSTGNRKTRVRIPAQSKAFLFFHGMIFNSESISQAANRV